ncbi:ATP-binding protein [Magnetovibrio sp. PR-2]|uniref:sensor histidine kinase n=1 Tax=Magnetovibrio sp. PR-2 TaxID=3120356 RepID=UPI002FCE676A
MANSRQTGFFLYVAYGVVMACMAALLYQSFNHWEVSQAARQTDLELEEKVRTAFDMRDAIRKRSFIFAYITVLDDFFDRDTQRQLSWEAANDFVRARARLEELGTDERELEYLKLMTEQIRNSQPDTERTMNLAVEGVRGPEMEEAILVSRQEQAKLLNILDGFVEHLDFNAHQIRAAQVIYLAAIRRDMMILGGAMFLVSLTIGLAVTRREADIRKRLLREVDERTLAENQVRELNRTLEVRVEKRTAERTMLAADHEIVAAILNASLAPLPLEEFLDEALRLVLKRQNLELLGMGAIFLVDEASPQKLKLVAERNLAHELQTLCANLDLGQCLCGRAALGETIIKTCLDHDHEVMFNGILEHGHMCVPISHAEQVLGVLNLYIPHGHHPSQHEQRLVETVADTLAGVIWRKRTEDMARTRQDTLAHVSRVNTMGELTANLAHEINQPLAAISNYATGSIRRLQANTLDDDSMRDVLNKIATQSERAGEVMRRIRSFVRKGEVLLEPLSLEQIVEETLLLTAFEAKRLGIEIRSECAPGVPPIFADKVQIEQVLLNIINNAMDELKTKPKDTRLIVVTTSLPSQGEALCSIWDNGEGLPSDEIEHVFEPFYSTKSDGMGMGLAISHSIIEACGGRLWVDPDFSEGTRFNFSLPIKTETSDNHVDS